MKDEVGELTPLIKRPRFIRHGGADRGMRRGRGFSISELKEAGLTVNEAITLGLPVDIRHKSKWPWNAESIRKFLAKIKYSSGSF